MNIELIPYGKENKISRKSLMELANIQDKKILDEEIVKLKKRYIIFSINTTEDIMYWRSNSKEELQEFIKKYQYRSYDSNRMIMLAYKELEEMENWMYRWRMIKLKKISRKYIKKLENFMKNTETKEIFV